VRSSGDAAQSGNDAVAAFAAPFEKDFFKNARPFRNDYKQHNVALKWFRQYSEWAEDSRSKWFDNTYNYYIPPMLKGAGMDYSFDCDLNAEWWAWHWVEMISQLDNESIDYVFGRSRGLVNCELCVRPGSYDHKRHHMLNTVGRPPQARLPVWDFVIWRDDGTGIRLHPQWSTPKVETYEVDGHAPDVEIPWKGLGQSNGPGTYRSYVDSGNAHTIRFDPAKKPPRGG